MTRSKLDKLHRIVKASSATPDEKRLVLLLVDEIVSELDEDIRKELEVLNVVSQKVASAVKVAVKDSKDNKTIKGSLEATLSESKKELAKLKKELNTASQELKGIKDAFSTKSEVVDGQDSANS